MWTNIRNIIKNALIIPKKIIYFIYLYILNKNIFIEPSFIYIYYVSTIKLKHPFIFYIYNLYLYKHKLYFYIYNLCL